MVVQELFARLGIDMDQSAFQRADAALGKLRLGYLAIGSAIAAAGTAAIGLVRHAHNVADEAGKAAQRVGMNVQAWQEISLAAVQAEVPVASLEAALAAMSRTALEARKGSKEAAASFASLGVSAADLRSLDTEQLFEKLVGAIAAMPEGFERTATVMKVFGRGGREMLPFILQGTEAIAAMRKEVRALGLVIDEEGLQAAEEYEQIWKRVGRVLEGVKIQVGVTLLKAFLKFVDVLKPVVKHVREFFMTFVRNWRTIVKMLAATAAAFVVASAAALAHAGVLGFVTGWYVKAGIAAVAAAVRAAVAWAAAAAPVVGMIALVAALVLLFEDFLVFLEGGDSLIGELGQKWTKFLDTFLAERPGDWWITGLIKDGLRALFDMQTAAERLFKLFSSLPAPVAALLVASGKYRMVPGIGVPGSGTGDQSAAGKNFDTSANLATLSSVVAPGLAPIFKRGATERAITAAKAEVSINVTAGPGAPPHEIAGAVRTQIEQWWQGALQETAAGTP